jgi:hypothetical protein
VVNLLGKEFGARAAPPTNDLLIGYGLRKLDVLLEGNLQVCWIHLRRLDPARIDPADLRRLLEGTAGRILHEVYGQADASLRDVLTELSDGEEFGVRAAQAVLLEGAGHYLRQFGLTAPRSCGRYSANSMKPLTDGPRNGWPLNVANGSTGKPPRRRPTGPASGCGN